MKPRVNFILFVLSILALGLLASCQTNPVNTDNTGDDDFDNVENNAKNEFDDMDNTLNGDDDNMDDLDDDTTDLDDDMKDPIEDNTNNNNNVETPKEDNEVDLDRYEKYWSNRKDPNYPNSRYLIGVGVHAYENDSEKGAAIRQASADGRNEIAAFFKAQIASEVKSEQEKLVTIQNNVRHVSSLFKNEYNLTQSVQQSVKGAEVKGIAYDKKIKMVYVLVVLDRKKAAEIINEQLKAMKSKIESYLSVYQTAISEGKTLKAVNQLAKAINMVVAFNAKRQEAIFIAPEGFDIVDLGGIEEGGLVQQLAEITIDLTFMVKSIVKTTDENDVTKVEKLNSVTSKISEKLRKSSNLITLKMASAKLRGASFDDVAGWGLEDLKAAAPDTNIIILASLEAVITGSTEVAGRTAYTAHTNFSVQMIDVETGEIVHSIDSGDHNLMRKTKAMLNNTKSALNASIGKAADAIADEIFSFLNPA